MKKLFFLILIFFLFSSIALPHREWVHQYLVQESYNFLEMQLGYEITDLKNHIGFGFYGSGDNDDPWATGYIGVAAWREDMEDVIWGYGGWFNGWDPSITHFWKADDGDNVLTPIPSFGNAENAYYKARIFLFGGHRIFFKKVSFDPDIGQVILGRFYSYNSLFEFFRTGRCYYEGYIDLAGYVHLNSTQEIYMDITAAQKYSYQILGRVSHLLADMSVPAHSHNDFHPCNFDPDYYEHYMGGAAIEECDESQTIFPAQNWNKNTASSYGGLLPLQSDNLSTARYLFYTLNQLADHFPSGPGAIDYPGNNSLPNGSYPILISRYQALGDPPTSIHPVENIANETFNYVIRATATLYYLFAVETGLIAKVTAKNNFDYGTIKVGVNTLPTQRNSPYIFGSINGWTVNLEAQNQTYEAYDWIWNTSGVQSSLSNWKKKAEGSPSPDPIYGASNINYSFNVAINDHNSEYIADLKKIYKVSRQDQTEFDGTISAGVVTQIVEQNSGQITAPINTTINGRTYNFFGWSDGSIDNPRTVTPTNNETYTALYKLPHHSNQTNAFENSSARKFIKTSDGVMHLVYESMGRVWYEQSTDNGVNWILMNDGKPLDNGNGECPSIDFGTIGEHILILIAYQETNIYSQTSLKVAVFKSAYGFQPYELIETETIFTEMIGYRVNPVISIHSTNTSNSSGSILISWQDQSEGGLFYRLAGLNMDGINLTGSNIRIAETSVNSINPASSTKRIYDSNNKFHLVWQENEEIKYCTFFSQSAVATLSTNSGYDVNIQPSIVVLNDNIARISWVGERMDESESIQSNVVFMAPDNPSHFWTFGNNVSSTNINRPDNVNAYVIGWSEDDGNVNQIVDNHLSQSYIRNLNQVGKDIQICNGSTFSDMYATIFNTSNSPYFFNLSNDIQSYYTIPKNTSTTSISEGREGIVAKNKLQFYFGVGDVKVDNELVSFKEIADTVRFSNLQTLNQYLTTEPFPLTDNSSFYYSVQFGVTDTSYAQNSLSANSFVKFRVLLLDNNTNQLLGVYDEVTYTLDNLLQHKNIAYQVNTNGVGNRTVRLALEVTENIEPKYALAEKYADDYVITKEKYETIEYKGKLGITEYALLQNYPNPFNPVTTVNYQIPKSGRVVLKVYDILGREVATLVNEEKETGRYTVNFDASALSSGVYLYEIVVNDYRAVKKLMVIK